MARFKYDHFLERDNNSAYDQKHAPGVAAPYAGVYRCVGCGHEIGIAYGHTLPPQDHHQHPTGVGKIEWQLVVFAQHKK